MTNSFHAATNSHLVFYNAEKDTLDDFLYAVRYRLKRRVGLFLHTPSATELTYDPSLGLVSGDLVSHWKETMWSINADKVFECYIVIVISDYASDPWDTPGLRLLMTMGNYGPLRVALFAQADASDCPYAADLHSPVVVVPPPHTQAQNVVL